MSAVEPIDPFEGGQHDRFDVTRQAGDGLGVDAAEFRHQGQQGRRGDVRHSGNQHQDLGLAGQHGVFGQPLAALGIDGGEIAADLRQPRRGLVGRALVSRSQSVIRIFTGTAANVPFVRLL